MFEKILLVTDFSKNSLKVLPPVVAMAKAYNSKILVCHVDEEEQILPGLSSSDIITFLRQLEARRANWLESVAFSIQEKGVQAEVLRLKGYASKEIVRYARENAIPLLAMSALGGEGFKSLMLGSTSANVLRNLDSPLLFVSAHCTPAEGMEIRRILYPTDFSAISQAGVLFAARLARQLGAHLELFHVLRIPSFIPSLPGEPPLAMPPSVVDDLGNRFNGLMESLVRETQLENVSYEVTIGADESQAITSAAVSKKVDLIVIPRRGEGVLEGLLFGRTAENVAKLAPVPTLLFHPEETV